MYEIAIDEFRVAHSKIFKSNLCVIVISIYKSLISLYLK